MILVFSIEAPRHWVLAGNDGKLVRSGVVEDFRDLPNDKNIERRTGILPGDRVTIHQLDIPAKNRKLLEQAIPNALEPELAADIADLYFIPLTWIKGKRVTVAVIAKRDLDDVLSELDDAGLSVDGLTPEYFLLPLKEPGSYTLAYSPQGGGLLARTGPETGLLLDKAWLDRWLGSLADSDAQLFLINDELADRISPQMGAVASVWSIGSSYADWLKYQPVGKLPNILPKEFRKKVRGGGRWAWMLLAASVALWLGVDTVEYFHLNRLNTRLDQQLSRTFREMFPDVKRIELGKIRFQAKSEIAKRQGAVSDGEYFTLLDAVSTAVRGSRASIQSIDYRKGEMVLYVTLPDYALADRLKQRFDQDRRVKAELVPSGTSGNNAVTARYKLRLVG